MSQRVDCGYGVTSAKVQKSGTSMNFWLEFDGSDPEAGHYQVAFNVENKAIDVMIDGETVFRVHGQ